MKVVQLGKWAGGQQGSKAGRAGQLLVVGVRETPPGKAPSHVAHAGAPSNVGETARPGVPKQVLYLGVQQQAWESYLKHLGRGGGPGGRAGKAHRQAG